MNIFIICTCCALGMLYMDCAGAFIGTAKP